MSTLLDPNTMSYEEIAASRREAVSIRGIIASKPLMQYLDRYIMQCTANLPSHDCYLEEGEIILEDQDNEWKHIVRMIEQDPGEVDTDDEFYDYACCKRYELKHQIEPHTYNQTPPGLYANYPYLYRVRISQATRYEIQKLHLKRLGAKLF